MYLCFGSSNEYAKYTGVAIASVLENNRETDIDGIFVLSFGIDGENRAKLKEITDAYNRKLEIIDASEKMKTICEGYGISSFRGSLATYSRAFIDELVPEYVGRMLYIDTDTVTIGSLSDLCDFSMEGKVMAAVVDTSRYDRCYTWSELVGKNEGFAYHSCGVLLYDLDEWRKKDCRALIAEEIHSGRKFKYADQSLINNAIPQEWIALMSYRFNYWGHMYPAGREMYELNRGGFYTQEELEHTIADPVIVHYPGILGKSWFRESISRRKELYSEYIKLTPWRDEPIESIEPTLDKKYRKKGVKGRFKLAMVRWKATAKTPFSSKVIERIESVVNKND